MVEEARPPVAIRSIRPYATEDAFLAAEQDTLTATTITLVGAPSRPRGVILRFEVTLKDGKPLLRGEGRVQAFRPAADGRASALLLRFTRLDSRSKALIDKAVALRDAAAAPADEPSPTDPAPADAPPNPQTEPATPSADASPRADTAPPPARTDERHTAQAEPARETAEAQDHASPLDWAPTTPPDPLPSTDLLPVSTSSPSLPTDDTDVHEPPPQTSPDPATRDTLLGRLRTRARSLSAERVTQILAARRHPS